MIDVENLMIGDWILLFGKTPIKVETIQEESINYKYSKYSKELEGGFENQEIDPLPLTAEILEKNGWILDEIDGSYRHKETGFWIGGRNAPFGLLISNTHKEIKYVHELQHILKECEINIKFII